MPQYNDPKVAHFQVEIVPKPFWRRLKIWPYFVGNRVEYKLRITDIELRRDATVLYLFEIFDGEERQIKKYEPVEIDGNWKDVVGNQIDREGNVIYKIGSSPKSIIAEAIFSTHVINTDRWLPGCISFILGIIAAIVAGIVLGFIDIEPFWRMWLP